MRILTVKQMRDAEAASEKLGVSLWLLMQSAGGSLAEFTLKKAAELGAKKCVILCGSGNNGGDGFVCADILSTRGLETQVVLFAGEPKTELAVKAFARLADKVPVITMPESGPAGLSLDADILIDCVFGTGFHGEFRTSFTPSDIPCSRAYRIACDMPSGVDADSGRAATGTLKCDCTLTFHAPKLGMALMPARELCGEVEVADIGIPSGWEELASDKTHICDLCADDLQKLLPPRPAYSHKGTFGRLLLVCGCESYMGAAAIASRAALHSGCGIVQLASVPDVIKTACAAAPECVYTPLPADSQGYISPAAVKKVLDAAALCDAVVIGCGLGQEEGGAKLVEALICGTNCPVVIDADGINLLARNIDILKDKTSEIILTPHIGELARLTGNDVGSTIAARCDICRELAEKYGVTVHSKDATSMTFFEDNVEITSFGCSALAKGGSGDMLAGVIGSLLAQGIDPPTACTLGDFIVGRTAELLSERYSPAALTASDIIDEFKSSLKNL